MEIEMINVTLAFCSFLLLMISVYPKAALAARVPARRPEIPGSHLEYVRSRSSRSTF